MSLKSFFITCLFGASMDVMSSDLPDLEKGPDGLGSSAPLTIAGVNIVDDLLDEFAQPSDEMERIAIASFPLILSFQKVDTELLTTLMALELFELPVVAKLWEKENTLDEIRGILGEIMDAFSSLMEAGGSIIGAKLASVREDVISLAMELYKSSVPS